jgi:MFS transporter, Spinster family, sphingosine-1-phosphate transporter
VIASLHGWVDRLSRRPNYKWVVVGLLFFAGFLNLEDRVVIFSVMPLLRAELQLSDVFVGALMTVFLWTYALSSPLAGYFGDRLPRKRVVVGCLCLWSLVTTAAGLIETPAQLMTTRVLLAVTEAFYIPTALAILADHHTTATRGKAVATFVIGMNLGPVLGGAMAGWIGDHYGWRPTLIVLGLVGLSLAIVMAVFLRDVRVGASEGPATPPPRPTAFGETLREILGTPSVVAVMLAVGTFSLGAWMLITWLPLFLYDTFRMNLAQSGFFGNLAITGPVFVGAFVGGILSDRLGAKRPQRRMLLLLGFYTLALPWPLLFSVSGTATLVLASTFLFQLCRALGELNSHPLLFELVAPEKRSTAVGIQSLGALIVGKFRASLGFQTVFGLVPVLIALCVGGLLLAYLRWLDRDLARMRPQKPVIAPEPAQPQP